MPAQFLTCHPRASQNSTHCGMISDGSAPPSFGTLDRFARAMTARLTQGVSPHAQYAAWFDWASHLARAPGRQLELWLEAAATSARLTRFAMRAGLGDTADVPFRARGHDRRFDDPAWGKLPYLLWQQAFLAQEGWWRSATREVRGTTAKNTARVRFMALQALDLMSPSNVPWLNPALVEGTTKELGANLARGGANFIDDALRVIANEPRRSADGFRVGMDLAITPGEVIYRNELMELINTSPQPIPSSRSRC